MSLEHIGSMLEDSTTSEIVTIISEIQSIMIDRKSIPQERLNLANRSRKSLFPWRGQFSPELIELLLSEHADSESVVLDPFAGSGTTLFEAANKGLMCFGSEINPAAFEMARTVSFAKMDTQGRRDCIRKARAIMEKYLPYFHTENPFSFETLTYRNRTKLEEAIRNMLFEASENDLVHNILVNMLLRYAAVSGRSEPNRLWHAFKIHEDIIEQLPHSKNPCTIFHRDARKLPLDDNAVDLIVSSPPYINVFNYHQNYRKVMELAGWNLLQIARSEIGSNRKNRMNRFLTVIQYAIDMLQALCEVRRVVKEDGKIIIIIGRGSKVRGVSFENYKIICTLAMGRAGLKLVSRQERQFVNRFGQTIYEDLLYFVPSRESAVPSDDFAREVGAYFLKKTASSTPHPIRQDILFAVESAKEVKASPIFIDESCRAYCKYPRRST